MSLVERIKSLAVSKKMTFAELERALGLANSSIRKWDASSPSSERLQKVADHFQVSTDYLLGRTETPYYALKEKDEPSIQADLERLIEELDGFKYSKKMAEFSEDPKELLIASLEQAVRIAKMKLNVSIRLRNIEIDHDWR